MAFEISRLGAQVDSIGGGLIRIFGYNAGDTITQMLAADYIPDAAGYGLRLGDLLIVQLYNGFEPVILVVSSIDADGNATLSLTDQSKLSVRWFGATGDGVTDDTDAVQAAIDYATTITGSSSYNLVTGVTVEFPEGEYLTDTGWTIIGDGVKLRGVSHRGSILSTNTEGVTVLRIGDPTYATQTYRVGLEDMGFLAKTDVYNSNDTIGIQCHDTIFGNFQNLLISNFNKGIEGFRLNSTWLDKIEWNQHQRTANIAEFALGLFGRSTNGDSSGNNKLSNFEIYGAPGMAYPWEDGILIRSADGLYCTNGHIYKCAQDIHISPDGTNLGNTITDLRFNNVYLDSPRDQCLVIDGQTVSPGGGIGGTGVYQNIMFDDSCVFRGDAGNAVNLVLISIDAVAGAVQDITLKGDGRQAGDAAVVVAGSSSGKVDIDLIFEMHLRSNNWSGTATNTGLSADIDNLLMYGARFGADQVAGTHCVQATTSIGGNNGVLIQGCDFSESNCTGDPINYSAATGNVIRVSSNLYPNQGQTDTQARVVATAGATPTVIWTYALPEGKVIKVSGTVIAAMATGTENAAYTVSGLAYRDAAAGLAWLYGPTNASLGETTAGLNAALSDSGNSVLVTVTGLAATAIDWIFLPEIQGN